MMRAIAVWCLLIGAGAGYAQVQAARQQASPSAPAAGSRSGPPPAAGGPAAQPSPSTALLDTYCLSCHNTRVRAAGLMLDEASRADVGANAEVWEKVVRKLRTGAMPPVGRPRPDAAAVSGLVSTLEAALDRAAAGRPNPGRAVVHRLNRSEYGNAVRDLLALEIDARALLPGDNSDHGFDNIADVLSLSPVLMGSATRTDGCRS